MKDAFITDGIRTPIGNFRGALSAMRADDLAAYVMRKLVERNPDIPADAMELLRGLDVLFLDALRHKPHPTHSTVERSLETVGKLSPRRAFFTHISHDLGHACTEERLPPNVRLAYDGMQIDVEPRMSEPAL